MGLRFTDMSQLRKAVSPDVEIVDDGEKPTELNKQLRKADKEATETLEDKFYALWRELGGVELEAQHVFHPERKWRFDFSIETEAHKDEWVRVAFEIQGGIYAEKSGHRSFEGVQRDYEKLNAAQMLGWKVFQVTPVMMRDHSYIQQLVDYVEGLCYS